MAPGSSAYVLGEHMAIIGHIVYYYMVGIEGCSREMCHLPQEVC